MQDKDAPLSDMQRNQLPISSAARVSSDDLTYIYMRSSQEKDAPLSDMQRDKFEDLLRGLTAERTAVRDAMVFALDHADCAAEVVEILTEALTLDETPIPTKVLQACAVAARSANPHQGALEYAHSCSQPVVVPTCCGNSKGDV